MFYHLFKCMCLIDTLMNSRKLQVNTVNQSLYYYLNGVFVNDSEFTVIYIACMYGVYCTRREYAIEVKAQYLYKRPYEYKYHK